MDIKKYMNENKVTKFVNKYLDENNLKEIKLLFGLNNKAIEDLFYLIDQYNNEFGKKLKKIEPPKLNPILSIRTGFKNEYTGLDLLFSNFLFRSSILFDNCLSMMNKFDFILKNNKRTSKKFNKFFNDLEVNPIC